MSVKSIFWAMEKEVFSSSQKLVLLVLANFASETGKAYPAVATICRMTSQTDVTVRNALAELVKRGVIIDTGKRTGITQQVKVYQLPIGACETEPLDEYKTCEKTCIKTHKKTYIKTCEKEGQSIEALDPKTKKENNFPAVPEALRDPGFLKAWEEWLNFRQSKRKPVSAIAASRQLEKCQKWGVEKSIQSIDRSIQCDYQGLFPVQEHRRSSAGSVGCEDLDAVNF